MASEAMSVDSGPESEFDFGDLDSAAGARKGRLRERSVTKDANILVKIQAEQHRTGSAAGLPKPPLTVPTLPTNQRAMRGCETEEVKLPRIVPTSAQPQ